MQEVSIEAIVHDPITDISLRGIARENVRAICRLRLDGEQAGYVAENAVSIAEAYTDPSFHPLAIYHGNEPVGFTMYGQDPETSRWWVIRLMIAPEYQGRGYGRAAMHLLIRLLAERHGARQVTTSYVVGNEVAGALYRSLGFRDTGEIEDDECVVVLDLPETVESGNVTEMRTGRGTGKDGTTA